LRSINQISLLLVNFKFNGRQARPLRKAVHYGATPMQASRKSANRTIDAYDVLPPDPATRRPAANSRRAVVIEDAVFEVIVPSPASRQYNDNPEPHQQNTHARIDVPRIVAVAGVLVVNKLERHLSRLSPQAFVTLSASLFFIAFWLFGGFNALATEPIAKADRPFAVEQVFIEEQDANGMKLLSIGGRLVNRSGRTLDVPMLTVASESGAVIGTIRPDASEIEAGSSVPFSARLKLDGGKSGEISIFPDL